MKKSLVFKSWMFILVSYNMPSPATSDPPKSPKSRGLALLTGGRFALSIET